MPARIIGDFNRLKTSRIKEFEEVGDMYDDPVIMWERFYKIHENK